MQRPVKRFLRSMQAAGVRHLPPARPAPAPPATTPAATTPAAKAPAALPVKAPAGAAESARPLAGRRDEGGGQRGEALSVSAGAGLFDRRARAADPEAELSAVAAAVAACRACRLCETRQKTVPGEGDPQARIVFVGEGPGAEEDRTGRPFVGRAGQLLDDIITKGMRLRRQDVFICNVVKCRPPGNRLPEPDEVAACSDYLDRQLLALAPAVICCLGATAVRRVLDQDRPMSQMRGRTHRWRGIPVIVTYHPAYLLRNPAAKAATWQDIRQVMELARAT